MMSVLIRIISVLWFSYSYGLEVLAVQQPVTDISPYLFQGTALATTKEHSLKTLSAPKSSKATPGMVTTRLIPIELPLNLIVLGQDALSQQWIRTHQDYLKHFHGLGLVVNSTNPETLSALEALTGISLVAANVDALMALINEHHYPLVIERGQVWQ